METSPRSPLPGAALSLRPHLLLLPPREHPRGRSPCTCSQPWARRQTPLGRVNKGHDRTPKSTVTSGMRIRWHQGKDAQDPQCWIRGRVTAEPAD